MNGNQSKSKCCMLKLKPGEYFREISVIFRLRYFEQLWQFVHVCVVCASGRLTLVSDAAPDSVVCPGPGWQHFWRSRQVLQRWFVSCWHHNLSRTSFWTPSPQPGHEHWADLHLADTVCHRSTLELVLDANQTKTLAFWTGVCFSCKDMWDKLQQCTKELTPPFLLFLRMPYINFLKLHVDGSKQIRLSHSLYS